MWLGRREYPKYTECFREALHRRGAQYFNSDRVLRVVPVGARVHPNSEIYEFTLHSDGRSHRVLVKAFGRRDRIRLERTEQFPVHDRPRLFPRPETSEKFRYEFRALSAVERRLNELRDSRLHAVRPLDLLTSPPAFVMEKLPYASLRRALKRAHRGRPGRKADVETAFAHAGLWLRTYHELGSLEHSTPRLTTRGEVLAALQQCFGYLQSASDRPGRYPRLLDALASAAEEHLPPSLPQVLAHGDYAPRNVLVGPQQRVAVIDTLGRWQAAPYRDLAQFLMATKASGVQVGSLGYWHSESQLERLELEFLRGYFGPEPIPWTRIRIFESLLTAEWWGALIYRSQEARGLRGAAKWIRCRACHRFIHGSLERIAGELHARRYESADVYKTSEGTCLTRMPDRGTSLSAPTPGGPA